MLMLGLFKYNKIILPIPIPPLTSVHEVHLTVDTNLLIKHIRWDLIHNHFPANQLECHLSQLILFYKETLKLTIKTHIAVVHNGLEVEKRSNERI